MCTRWQPSDTFKGAPVAFWLTVAHRVARSKRWCRSFRRRSLWMYPIPCNAARTAFCSSARCRARLSTHNLSPSAHVCHPFITAHKLIYWWSIKMFHSKSDSNATKRYNCCAVRGIALLCLPAQFLMHSERLRLDGERVRASNAQMVWMKCIIIIIVYFSNRQHSMKYSRVNRRLDCNKFNEAMFIFITFQVLVVHVFLSSAAASCRKWPSHHCMNEWETATPAIWEYISDFNQAKLK